MALAVPALAGGAAYAAAAGLHAAGDVAYVLGGAVMLKTTFSVRMLGRASLRVGEHLQAGQVQQAREGLRALVSRDTSLLPPPLLASAAIESSAENTADSIVAPWLAFAVFGLPGAFAYRAVNTLDAMIGYHGRYEFLGKASARLDDLLNLLPARIAALCIAGATLFANRRHRFAWLTLWHDHARTESPNAGWPMAAMAGALGIRLEKPGHYVLNPLGDTPEPRHIAQAVQLTWLAALLALILTCGAIVVRHVIV